MVPEACRWGHLWSGQIGFTDGDFPEGDFPEGDLTEGEK